MKVVLCICTYRRPDGLARLLEALRLLQLTVSLEVVVADNDKQGQGLQLVQSLPHDYPYTVHSLSETRTGISAARNSATTLALTMQPDLVAYLDDDEWPEPQWLAELLRIQKISDAHAVGGPTRPVFPDGTPAHLLNNPYYGADLSLPDGSACQLQAGGNFLIRADTLRSYAPDFFHPSFAHSGGEDLAFFTQLGNDGHRMAWAANAIVHEPVPSNRLVDSWLRQRVVNIHNSRVRVMQLLHPGLLPALIRGVKTTGLGLVAAGLTLLSVVLPRWRTQARMLRWKFKGKLTAHIGLQTVRGETY